MSRSLDFLVIGAQKAGTTSLWQYLRTHPRLVLPSAKEIPFFSLEQDQRISLDQLIQRHFAQAPPDALLGKVTTHYMIGRPGIDVGCMADRIASALPAAKLIALLRDPIERAVSGYTMAVMRGEEGRSVDTALLDLLRSDELARARRGPVPTSEYVVLGEYGRILDEYYGRFPREQLLVVFTQELSREPGGALDAVLDFLGLAPGFRPEGLGVRHFRGGTRKRLDPEGEKLLRTFFEEDVAPHLRGDPAAHIAAFRFFMSTWNVLPSPPPPLSAEARARLEEHYRSDAEVLAGHDIRPPWVEAWEGG